MAKIYLASPSIYQSRMRVMRYIITTKGHTVTSRWLNEKELGRMTPNYAQMDIEDIDDCDVFMLYPLRRGDTNPTSGHMWEAGYAYSQDKLLLLMGEPTSLFLTLPRFLRCNTLNEALRHMEELR